MNNNSDTSGSTDRTEFINTVFLKDKNTNLNYITMSPDMFKQRCYDSDYEDRYDAIFCIASMNAAENDVSAAHLGDIIKTAFEARKTMALSGVTHGYFPPTIAIAGGCGSIIGSYLDKAHVTVFSSLTTMASSSIMIYDKYKSNAYDSYNIKAQKACNFVKVIITFLNSLKSDRNCSHIGRSKYPLIALQASNDTLFIPSIHHNKLPIGRKSEPEKRDILVSRYQFPQAIIQSYIYSDLLPHEHPALSELGHSSSINPSVAEETIRRPEPSDVRHRTTSVHLSHTIVDMKET
ncbi:hypothetical protein [Xenorhabdus sp. IM139775]|uniref:hypothetical protein n=1 Tax=Xenorhabdus sp. IM139775 TaxID=3025876 RepID=UPI0023583145|nr:hypothetical protein [Xenorhabdus sp. IM139775]MDC9594106.1 hypothetical protein [Xenorhabdus sp. IM139775]